jgi:hypothetical protein
MKKTLAKLIQDVSKTQCHETTLLTPELIDLIVTLALKTRPWTARGWKSVDFNLSKHTKFWSIKFLYRSLVYSLAVLCNTVPKGKNKKMLTRYLNCRINVAPRHPQLSGVQFLYALNDEVRNDLQTVFSPESSERR